MTPPRRICLVSPSHVASNPRLVKEADALQAAGYDVHVVASWYFPPLDKYDLEIYAAAPWERTVVYAMTGPRVFLAKLLHRFIRNRIRHTLRGSLAAAARAHHSAALLLANAAKHVRADLYIGHCLAGLPAAAWAARQHHARYGFDAEDFHSAETENVLRDPVDAFAVRTIESTLVPGCSHVTASSPLIGRAYEQTYPLTAPVTTVLNTFPLSQAPNKPVTEISLNRPVKLYWFSQTVGPGRGLEPLLRVLGKMRTKCELHLRGLPSPNFIDTLRHQAIRAGFMGKIEFLRLASAAEMPRLAAQYDLGLSLEQRTPLNRDLCLTNKIFTYLLAGVPVALTPTSAQDALGVELGDAALILDLAEPEKTAAILDAFFQSPERRAAARAAAWKLGQTRFNWNVEQTNLLQAVESAFHQSPAQSVAS